MLWQQVQSLSPNVVKKVTPADGVDMSLKRNVLVKIDIDPKALGGNFDVIGVLEEADQNKFGSSVPYRVSVLYDAPSFYTGDYSSSSVYFSFRLEHIPAGRYKFRLRSANRNDMTESNAVDFEIVSLSSNDGALAMGNDNDDGNMDSDGGSNGSNFDDFDDYDSYERQLDDDVDKKGDGNGLGDDFTGDDFDAMFDKDSEIRCQDGDADECEDSRFQTQVIIKNETKESAYMKNVYTAFFSHHFLLVVTMVLMLTPIMERANKDEEDSVFVYGSLLVERLGVVDLSRKACSYLLGKDCSAHIYSRADFSGFRVQDYYRPTREPVPFLAAAIASAFPVVLLVRIMLWVFTFPKDLYARDQFGCRTAVMLCLLGMLRTILEGYHPIYILPLVGPIIVWYLCWQVFLSRYANDAKKYKKIRSAFICAYTFFTYLAFLPVREWIVMRNGISADLDKNRVPPTIAHALPSQKAFSGMLFSLLYTREKGYFPMDWIVIHIGASLFLSMASACAHELSKEDGTFDGVILNCCQIFPYYLGPLLFTGHCGRFILRPLVRIARERFEMHSGLKWDRADNCCL